MNNKTDALCVCVSGCVGAWVGGGGGGGGRVVLNLSP